MAWKAGAASSQQFEAVEFRTVAFLALPVQSPYPRTRMAEAEVRIHQGRAGGFVGFSAPGRLGKLQRSAPRLAGLQGLGGSPAARWRPFFARQRRQRASRDRISSAFLVGILLTVVYRCARRKGCAQQGLRKRPPGGPRPKTLSNGMLAGAA